VGVGGAEGDAAGADVDADGVAAGAVLDEAGVYFTKLKIGPEVWTYFWSSENFKLILIGIPPWHPTDQK
jgi:hypothetical protein